MIITSNDYEMITHDTAPIFLKKWFLDSVCGEDNWASFIVQKDPQCWAVLPFFVTGRTGQKVIEMPECTQYAGPFLHLPANCSTSKRLSYEEKLISELLSDLETYALDNSIVGYAQRWGVWISNWIGAYWRSYNIEGRYTFQIDCTQGYDACLRSYTTQARNKLKHRDFVKIYVDSDSTALYTLLKKSLDYHSKVPAFSEDMLQRICVNASCHNQGCCIYAEIENRICSGAFLLWDNKYLYYYVAGNARKNDNGNASTLLIDYAIRMAAEKGLIFDFTGSMIPGLVNFYQSFGAEPIEYSIVDKVYSKESTDIESFKENRRSYVFKF